LLAAQEDLTEAQAEVERLQGELDKAKKRVTFIRNQGKDLTHALRAQEKEVDALEDADEEEIKDQMFEGEEVNKKIRANQEKGRADEELKRIQAQAKELTAQITAIDQQKTDALSKAKFPIPGLSFDENSVLFNDIPFSQAADSEKLKISVAMGLAMNPELKVLLIREGSLLDADNLKLIADMADQADAQVWIERVGEGKECSVIISDGEVKGG
jgi:hypothetical protein